MVLGEHAARLFPVWRVCGAMSFCQGHYEATTLILVQPQEIPQSYVQATVSPGVEERVRTLSQEVLSRSNLETIIKEMKLFARRQRARVLHGYPGGLTAQEDHREHQRSRPQGRDKLFHHHLQGEKSQERWQTSPTGLPPIFIDSNLKLRARQATETTAVPAEAARGAEDPARPAGGQGAGVPEPVHR
ncbi:MAG: hypothetical protein MZU91_03280 [Desulfosudis oleivorans]|nr:hypothetical protein [Desulfosudis oleivorans]